MDIGHKIKQLRIQKGLTLEELASRSELTKGFLSQTERNLTSPSIATLNDIVEALGTSLSEFFKEDKEERIVFRKRDFFVDERDHCTVNWIVPNTQKNEMEPFCWNCPRAGNPSPWTRTAVRSSATSSKVQWCWSRVKRATPCTRARPSISRERTATI